MRRFDRSIKVLQAEMHRITGKEVFNWVERGQKMDLNYATKGIMVQSLAKAISILEKHPDNKHV